MKGFEDPYKSEGIVQLKIEKLSQFAQEPLDSYRYGEVIYVRGLPWKIFAQNLENDSDKQVELKQKVLGYFLECCPENADPAWSCTCSATLKVLAQKEGQEDYVDKFSHIFNAKNRGWGEDTFMTFEALMNPELGWYDKATDSIILQTHITADAPHGVKNMPDDTYTQYTMRGVHSLFVEMEDGSSNCHKSSMPIEDKLWSFTYSPTPSDKMLYLEMSMHQSDANKPIAECIFWYWNDKEIAILQKRVHAFGEEMVKTTRFGSGMISSKISLSTNGAIPANKKFNVVIRLLDECSPTTDNNSLESYYGNCDGVETVTLCIRGHNNEEASFIVPKYVLTQASLVFQRMLASEMTEKASGKIVIEDTNPEEFGDFLKAISPKQEHPNPSNVFALVKLADRYDCQTLRDRCELHLMDCVEIPFIHRLTCANFYGLDKLKNNLMVSLDGTGLHNLLKQTGPYLDILNELTRERKHK